MRIPKAALALAAAGALAAAKVIVNNDDDDDDDDINVSELENHKSSHREDSHSAETKISIKCSSCSAPLTGTTGTRIVCPYCTTTQLLK